MDDLSIVIERFQPMTLVLGFGIEVLEGQGPGGSRVKVIIEGFIGEVHHLGCRRRWSVIFLQILEAFFLNKINKKCYATALVY
jgi:hypothetical protein